MNYRDFDHRLCARRSGAARKAAILACAVSTASLMAACGGGGSEVTTTAAPSMPAPTVLNSSNGRAADYLGVWISGCGLALLSSNQSVKSVVNTYRFTAINGTSITGTLEQNQYSDTSCSKPWPGPGLPPIATASISIKIVGSTDVGPVTDRLSNYTGTADRVELTMRDASGRSSVATQFIAFSGGNKLRLTTKLPFSDVELTYTRL